MQLGFHGVAGLGLARALVRKVPEASAPVFTNALVLGSLLPDLDIYPNAVVTLCCGKAAADGIHRSATHSLLLLAMLVAASYVPARRERLPWFLRGLAIGVAGHLLADSFMWFAHLDLFWPFSHLPTLATALSPLHQGWAPPRVRLFGNPGFIENMLGAVEFAAFACFFVALARVAAHQPSTTSMTRRIAFWQRVAWACFAIAVAVGIRARSEAMIPLVYGPWLLIFTPLCWIYTVRLRNTIGPWALSRSSRPTANDERRAAVTAP